MTSTGSRPLAPQARGLTLVEIVIALAVTSIVLVGVVAAFRAQQATFHATQKVRAAQGSARSALLFLEQKVPLAGTGMDGSVAFDLRGWTAAGQPCPPELNGCPVDSATDSDELVFFTRNPDYWVPTDVLADGRGRTWFFRGTAGNTVRLTAREGDRFERGQILQIVCQRLLRYAYVTVAVPADGPPDDGNPATLNTADVDVQVVPGNPAAPNPFQTQFLAGDTCFSAPSGPARVFQIDRYRFHVRPVPRGGNQYEPFLMLDTGVDVNRDGVVDALDEVVVADGIEVFQVGYSFVNPALGTFGTTPGTPITFVPSPSDAGQTFDQIGTLTLPAVGAVPADETPFTVSTFLRYRTTPPNLPVERLGTHQGNITAVRIGLIARSPDPATDGESTYPVANRRLFNFIGAPDWIQDFADSRGGDDGYQRFTAETTINVPNLLVQVVPPF
jgi:type IV pilus assembly protein PilW